MKAVLSNRLYLEYTDELYEDIVGKYTFKLPPAVPNGFPRTIKMYNTIGKVVSLPIGCASIIPENYTVKDVRATPSADFPDFCFELRDDQKEIYDLVTDSCLINANPSWGKAQPAYSKIKTPEGWVTMGDIQVGDEVTTPDNRTSLVVDKFAHKDKAIYKITFGDARVVHACGEHLWQTQGDVLTTEEVLTTLVGGGMVHIPLCSPIYDSIYSVKDRHSILKTISTHTTPIKSVIQVALELLYSLGGSGYIEEDHGDYGLRVYRGATSLEIISVEYLDNQDCYCISIDSEDSLYLTDNYIVTHNTFTAISLATKFKLKTLVICHNTILRDQWEKEIKKTLGIDCGVIGSGRLNIDSPIVVSNIQTLRNHAHKYSKEFGLVIVDEVHRAPAKIFSDTLNMLKARYKIGLSATLKRKDGLHVTLPLYFSDVVHKASRANQLTPEVHVYKTSIVIPGDNSWAIRLNKLYELEAYYALIHGLCCAYAEKGHKVLVVADRVEFLNRLADNVPNAVAITGGTTNREAVLDKVRTGGANVLAGTTSIFKEGVSVNELSCLIIAVPLNNDPVLEQLIGRVQRKMEGKPTPIIVDPVLSGVTGRNQGYVRTSYYKTNAYKTTLIDISKDV